MVEPGVRVNARTPGQKSARQAVESGGPDRRSHPCGFGDFDSFRRDQATQWLRVGCLAAQVDSQPAQFLALYHF